MSDPEKIWLSPYHPNGGQEWFDYLPDYCGDGVPVAYVREDVAVAEIDRLRAALTKIGDHRRFGWTTQTEIAQEALEAKDE